VADNLEQFLCALDEPGVVNRPGKLNMTEVTGTLGHVFSARLALELPVDRAKKRIVETTVAGLRPRLVHRLGVEDVAHAHRLDFLRRQESELDLLDCTKRRTRVREDEVRHSVRVDVEIGICKFISRVLWIKNAGWGLGKESESRDCGASVESSSGGVVIGKEKAKGERRKFYYKARENKFR